MGGKGKLSTAGTENSVVGTFTQNTDAVGESLFSDILVITGIDFYLSESSPSYRCWCHNNQPKLLVNGRYSYLHK